MSKVDQIRALREANFERMQKLAKQPIAKTKPKASPVKAEVIQALRTEIESVANKPKKTNVRDTKKQKASRTNIKANDSVANIENIEASRTSKQERQKKYRKENKEKLREQAKERMRQKRQGKK